MSTSNPNRRSEKQSGGLPDLDTFEQYVTQADVDRDPFAVALFEVKPTESDDPRLLLQLAQTLLQFTSPNTQVAYLGRNRFGLLSLTDDTTHRWLAPVTTALRVTLDRWWSAEAASLATAAVDAGGAVDAGLRRRNALRDGLDSVVDVSDLTDQPALVTGVARGLGRGVWRNAEQALAKAHAQQTAVAEFQVSDRDQDELFPSNDNRYRRAADPKADHDPGTKSPVLACPTADDDRLVVLSRRIEPVDRPEPIWYWLRLIPGLRTSTDQPPSAIKLNNLAIRDQALIEVWLANQVAELFANASAQLRISIPLSAEACKARSFAQRIFPLLERYRVPPSRLVVEIDMPVISRTDSLLPEGLPSSAPSVERFIRDAAAVNVGVAVTGFNGGWNAWYNLGDLPVDYLIPSPEMIIQAGRGDHGAIRALVLLASEADERGIELIAPDADSDVSEHALAQLGFTYGEGPTDNAVEALPAQVDDMSTIVNR